MMHIFSFTQEGEEEQLEASVEEKESAHHSPEFLAEIPDDSTDGERGVKVAQDHATLWIRKLFSRWEPSEG